ncbi:shikimate dehydrogenase [Balneolales bacterium ANBcel1]|nr:shikimate dehydrogenase [Balneolales bacterium ANBcel1]
MTLSEFLESGISETPFAAVIGHPVSHSLSPVIHNAALREHDIPAVYYAIDCPESQWPRLGELLSHEQCKGINVTLPLKRVVMDYLDDCDESAEAIGAVNTVVPDMGMAAKHQNSPKKPLSAHGDPGTEKTDLKKKSADKRTLRGYNTDAYGFIKPLETYPVIDTATVLGSGGASLAVQYALASYGVNTVYLASRKHKPGRIGRGHSKEAGQGSPIIPVSYSELGDAVAESRLIVNTTPVGMHPDTNATPFPPEMGSLLKGKICYDIIYNPLETRFLALAKQNGAETIDGLGMFVFQAARAFELWFDKPMPTELARSLVLEHLKKT